MQLIHSRLKISKIGSLIAATVLHGVRNRCTGRIKKPGSLANLSTSQLAKCRIELLFIPSQKNVYCSGRFSVEASAFWEAGSEERRFLPHPRCLVALGMGKRKHH